MKAMFVFLFRVILSVSALFLLTSYSTVDYAAPNQPVKLVKPEDIHISINYMDGTFTCSGAATTSGTWTMDVEYKGVTFHCINTLYAADGSVLVAISHCNEKTMRGTWQIKSGTGIFSNMKGNGSLVMYDATEEWIGAVRK